MTYIALFLAFLTRDTDLYYVFSYFLGFLFWVYTRVLILGGSYTGGTHGYWGTGCYRGVYWPMLRYIFSSSGVHILGVHAGTGVLGVTAG